jgi:hypothetical protein
MSLISGGGGGGPVPKKKKSKRFGPTRTTSLQKVQKDAKAARRSTDSLTARFSRVADFAASTAKKVASKVTQVQLHGLKASMEVKSINAKVGSVPKAKARPTPQDRVFRTGHSPIIKSARKASAEVKSINVKVGSSPKASRTARVQSDAKKASAKVDSMNVKVGSSPDIKAAKKVHKKSAARSKKGLFR